MVQKKQTEVLAAKNPSPLSERAFHQLSFADKRGYLQSVSSPERIDLILSDPDAKRLTRALEPQELFWTVKEVGEQDALDLLQLASGEQCRFILDLELWQGWSFSEEKACHWLAYFMEGGEPRIHELLGALDFEFLQLFLGRELIVSGGIGDVDADEEPLTDYDHSFDGTFLLKFKHPKHSRLIGSFVEMLLKLDNPLYVSLMEGIKGEVDCVVEEQCLMFRTGRLQDLGFPPLEEALSIYARVNPDQFQLEGDKRLTPAEEETTLVPVPGSGDSLLFRALALTGSAAIKQELDYLVNSALVAEGGAFDDAGAMVGILQRVCGYLNIALEKLAGSDVGKAAGLLSGERLKRLFQLGYSLVLQLKSSAQEVQTEDYASGKLLAGLKAKRPRFYRGLDADGVDGYREFRGIADVEQMAAFLRHLR